MDQHRNRFESIDLKANIIANTLLSMLRDP